jgi:hypothetical protein
VTRDHQVLVGGNHAHAASAVCRADRVFVRVVAARIERNPEMREAAAHVCSDRAGMLADTAGKDKQVEPAKRCRERTDRFSELIAEHLKRHRSVRIRRSRVEQRLHIG